MLTFIQRVLAGEIYMSGKLQARFAADFVSGHTLETRSPLDGLSDRELEVLRLIGQGRDTRQIAEALHLSIKTIESHREHLKQKLSLESGAELAQHATQWIENELAG